MSSSWLVDISVDLGVLAHKGMLSTPPSSGGSRGWQVEAGRRISPKVQIVFFKSVLNITFYLHCYQKNQGNLTPWKPLPSPDSL